jgi:hypothetical protein
LGKINRLKEDTRENAMSQISNLLITLIFVAPSTVFDQNYRNGSSLGIREKQNRSMKIMNYTPSVSEKQQIIN